MKYSLFMAIAGLGLLSGCATASAGAGLHEISQTVEQRTGLSVRWNQGTAEDRQAEEKVQSMLQQELTADATVQIALLNNPSLQAVFEELGIAQADLVQAGLLKNPVFAGHVRFPDKSADVANTEVSVSQDFTDIFLRPLRKKVAAAQFEQSKLETGHAVLKVAAEVSSAYYTLQGAEHTQRMLGTILQAARAAAELADRQYAAGNISDLELANQKAAYEQAVTNLTRAKAEVLTDRERLNNLMGLAVSPAWTISEQLPPLPATEPPFEELERRALSQRLDLAAVRQEVRALEQTVSLSRRGALPELKVGADTERDSDRSRVTGPSWEVELPVFDRRQGQKAKAEAKLRQSRRRLSALENQVRYEVRTTLNQLLVDRQLIEQYRDSIIPLKEKIVQESQKNYNFMLIGVFQLLQAKQEEVGAYKEYIEAFRDYWNARTELERVVGGRLPISEPIIQPAAASLEKPIVQEAVIPEKTHAHRHGGHS